MTVYFNCYQWYSCYYLSTCKDLLMNVHNLFKIYLITNGKIMLFEHLKSTIDFLYPGLEF